MVLTSVLGPKCVLAFLSVRLIESHCKKSTERYPLIATPQRWPLPGFFWPTYTIDSFSPRDTEVAHHRYWLRNVPWGGCPTKITALTYDSATSTPEFSDPWSRCIQRKTSLLSMSTYIKRNNSFIKILFTYHKVHPFKVHKWVVFTVCRAVQPSLYYRTCFITPKEKTPVSNHRPLSPFPRPW